MGDGRMKRKSGNCEWRAVKKGFRLRNSGTGTVETLEKRHEEKGQLIRESTGLGKKEKHKEHE